MKLTHAQLAEIHHQALAIEEGVLGELNLSTQPRTRGSESTRAPGYMRAREVVRQHPAAWTRWCRAEALRWQIAMSAGVALNIALRRYPVDVREDLHAGTLQYLFTAAVIWEPGKSTFATLARWWIRAGINRARLHTASGITLPGSMQEVRNTLARHGESGVANIHPDTVARARSFGVVSLDAPIGATRGDHYEVIGGAEHDPGDALDTERGLVELRAGLDELAARSPRTYRVIARRFGLSDGDEATLKVAGATIGVSRERARQIEDEALHALRSWVDCRRAPAHIRRVFTTGHIAQRGI